MAPQILRIPSPESDTKKRDEKLNTINPKWKSCLSFNLQKKIIQNKFKNKNKIQKSLNATKQDPEIHVRTWLDPYAKSLPMIKALLDTTYY